MNNYQLYRTNINLGGQMKWDIILNNIQGDTTNSLYVSDFHLSPISINLPYNRYAEESLLNYSHLENIKHYFKSIEGSFYKDYSDPLLTTDEPLIVKETGDKTRMNYSDHLLMDAVGLNGILMGNSLKYFVLYGLKILMLKKP